ncbi:MAG: 6-phosphofructokinase [Bacteroidales bacterium]|nr:6-phosphofructokinase [Bacteroidales bacterium]MBQ3175254.1 6-phosphofructokinase [Bacteroidales bacterium]
MKQSIVILTGGGPAPGMNTVVGSIAKTFIQNDYRVLGLHGGYKGLFSKNPNFCELDFVTADWIFNRGGSYLMMSRYKPTNEDFEVNFNLDFFKDNNIKLLVTVGGDDTASTANRIAKFLEAKNYPIANIHVPKTIDNDLPLPQNIPTFGYHSAKGEGTKIASTIYEDARTSGNWFVVSAMGRSAGHLALGIGATCHYPMIVIPEMFNKTKITAEKIINMAISAIIKRKIMGISYGAIMISEGVFHELSHEELEASGVKFTYDEHGHPELGKVSKAQLFNEMLENKLNALKIKVKSRPVEIGYEVRCVTPFAYDLMYCSQLGMGVYKLFTEGTTGCMVYVDLNGNVKSLYLKDMQDPETGKIPPRGVNIHTDKVQQIFDYLMHYITPEDYEAAKQYVANPEDYDFKKILNW